MAPWRRASFTQSEDNEGKFRGSDLIDQMILAEDIESIFKLDPDFLISENNR
jgi:hypothetical protein